MEEKENVNRNSTQKIDVLSEDLKQNLDTVDNQRDRIDKKQTSVGSHCSESTCDQDQNVQCVDTMQDMIDAIGGKGRFQLGVVVITVGSQTLMSMSVMLMSFAAAVPDWWCVPSDEHAVIGAENDTFQTCSVNETECNAHRFAGDMVTIVSQFDLVCEKSQVPSTVTTIQMVGVFVGAVVGGQLAEFMGRKKLFFAGVFLMGVSNLLSGIVQSWPVFAVFRFFIGSSQGAISVVNYVMALEVMDIKSRSFVSVVPWWIMGEGVFALSAYTLQDYTHICFVGAVFALPFLCGWVIVPESVRWLVVHGRTKEASIILRKIANVNGRQCPDPTKVFESIIKDKNVSTTKKYTYWDLFSNRVVARNMLLSTVISFTMGLGWYAIAFGIPALAGDIYLNLILSGVVGLPSYPMMGVLLHKLGRRAAICLCFTIAWVFCATFIIIKSIDIGEPQWADSLMVACAMIVKSAITMLWTGFNVHKSEIFPTVVRSLAYGACETVTRFGAIFGPVLISLDPIGGRLNFIVTGVLTFCCSFAIWLLPETRDSALEDIIDHEIDVDNKNNKPINMSLLVEDKEKQRTL